MLSNILLLCSALLYALPFIKPTFFSPFTFIFLVPLFFLALTEQLRVRNGVMWTFAAFGMHSIGFFVLMFERAHGWGRYASPAIVLLYFSLYGALWFWIMKRVSFLPISTWLKTLAVSISATGYFWIFNSGVFWILGNWYGYCFSHPLLPLAAYPEFLIEGQYIGLWSLTFCLIFFQANIAAWIVERKKWYAIGALVCLIPFFSGWFCMPRSIIAPEWFYRIGYIKPLSSPRNNPLAQAIGIDGAIEQLLSKMPHIKLIIMPESSFPFPLNQCQQSLQLWAQNCLSKDINLVIGAHGHSKGALLCNCMYNLHQGRIIQCYEKKHLMFFTEHMPFTYQSLQNFFGTIWPINKPFCCGLTSVPILQFSCIPDCIPLICSDLFLGNDIGCHGEKQDCMCLCISNDSWFSMAYIKNLMRLHAQLTATISSRMMLYASHEGMWFIRPEGWCRWRIPE